jgi:hypothetical protein
VLRIGAVKMKVVALVSGGKDSCYAMQRCIDYGHEVRFCADHGLGLNLNGSTVLFTNFTHCVRDRVLFDNENPRSLSSCRLIRKPRAGLRWVFM